MGNTEGHSVDSKENASSKTKSKKGHPLGGLETQNDIDPSNGKLVSRWKANRTLRKSGMEAAMAELCLGPNWKDRYTDMLEGNCPLAFSSVTEWIEFVDELKAVLVGAKITGWVSLRGSSSTFLSMHPEKGPDPSTEDIQAEYATDKTLAKTMTQLHYFDCQVYTKGGPEKVKAEYNDYELMSVYSDLDFNIKSPELVSLLKKSGAKPSSAMVGKCYNQDDTMNAIPGLWELKANWSGRLGRDLSFVCPQSYKDQHGYSNHPFTYPL